MTNAGKRMFNWRRDCPDVRVAFGLLGRAGYANKRAADALLVHSSLSGLRSIYKRTCGRNLTETVILSRMVHHEEVDHIQQEDPAAFRRGERIYDYLINVVKGTK